MGAPALVNADIELGEAIVRALDEAEVQIGTALWLYDSAASEWRLVLSTSLVEREGSLAAYERIQRVLRKRPDLEISLRQISLIAGTDALIGWIRGVARTPGETLAGRRFTGTVIGGSLVEDAYIFRST